MHNSKELKKPSKLYIPMYYLDVLQIFFFREEKNLRI